MSRIMRKSAFCICKNKGADQLCGNHAADQRLCFRYIVSMISLLSISIISSLQSPSLAAQLICVEPYQETPEDRFSHDAANVID